MKLDKDEIIAGLVIQVEQADSVRDKVFAKALLYILLDPADRVINY